MGFPAGHRPRVDAVGGWGCRSGFTPRFQNSATLVVLSELYPRAKLITVDEDFRRYRRHRNHAIPLVMPEGG